MIHMTWNAAQFLLYGTQFLLYGTFREDLSEEDMMIPPPLFGKVQWFRACDWQWADWKGPWFSASAAYRLTEGQELRGEDDHALPTCPMCKVLMDMCLEEGVERSTLKSERTDHFVPAPGFGSSLPFDEEDD